MHDVIHTLWLQGIADAPPVVRLCLDRWRLLNPRHELRVHDRAGARELLAGFPLDVDELSPQALSDVLRCRLLRDGGTWVDAATLPLAPLDSWLAPALRAEGFFAFTAAGDRPVASWLLSAAEHHPLVEAWWELIVAYWRRPRHLASVPGQRFIVPSDPVASVSPAAADGTTYPYFWFHYLFRRLIETDAAARDVWRRVPRISSLPPHALQELCRSHPDPSDEAIAAALAGTVVQKLDWRQPLPLDHLDRVLRARDEHRTAGHPATTSSGG